MIRTRYLALFAVAYYALMLLVTAPASLLDSAIHRTSDGRLSLSNSRGTIWRGSATPTLHTGRNITIPLHALSWQIRPQALLRGQLVAEINWDNPKNSAPMQLTLDRESVILKNILLPLPAGIIGELSSYLKPAQFSGNLSLESPQLAFKENQLQGNATVRWNQAGSALSSVYPLGDYQLDIVAAQGDLRATLSTQSGALLLNGQGSWSPAKGLHFNGTAHASEAAAPTLGELLHHLGPESSPGVYRISL